MADRRSLAAVARRAVSAARAVGSTVAGGRRAPAKQAAAPAKQAAAAAEKVAAPAKKVAAPAKKVAAPAKRAAAPAKKVAAPAKRAAAPPAKRAAAPAKKVAVPPAKRVAAPTKKAAAPTRKAAPRVKKSAEPARKAVAPAKKAAAPAQTDAGPSAPSVAPVADPATRVTLVVRAEEEPWTPAELLAVRTELAAELARLAGDVIALETNIADVLRDTGDGSGDDQADTGSKAFEREQEMTLLANARETDFQTRRALQAIDDGTYGVCESCGGPVGKARLQAFPRATLCMACKQRQERR